MASSVCSSISSFHGFFFVVSFSFYPVGALLAPAGAVHKHLHLRQVRQDLVQVPPNVSEATAATYDGAIGGVCNILEVVDGEVATTNETLSVIIGEANDKTQTFSNALDQARSLAQKSSFVIGQANVDKVVSFVDNVEATLVDLWSPANDYLVRSQENLLQIYAQFDAERTKEIDSINTATDKTALACGLPVDTHPDATSACEATAGAVDGASANGTFMLEAVESVHADLKIGQAWNPLCAFGGCKTSAANQEGTQAKEAHDAILAAIANTDELMSLVDQANATLDTYFTGLDQVLVNAVGELNNTLQQALTTYCQGLPSQALQPIQAAITAVLRLADEERANWMGKVQQKADAAATVRNFSAPIYSYLSGLDQKVTMCEAGRVNTVAPTAAPSLAPTAPGTAAAPTAAAPTAAAPTAVAPTAAPTAAPASTNSTTAAPAMATAANGEVSSLVLCSKWAADVVGTAGCLDTTSCFFTEPIKPGTCASTSVPVSKAMLGDKIAYIQPGATQVTAGTSLATLAIPDTAPTKELYAVVLSQSEVVIYDGCDVALPAMGLSASSSSAGALGPFCKNSAANLLLEFSPRATAALAASMKQHRSPL